MMRHILCGVSLAMVAVGLIAGPASGADDDVTLDRHARSINEAAATPPGQERVATRLADELNTASGLKPGPYTAASLQAQRAQNSWGWGEVLIANRLAQALAPTIAKQNPALTPAQALNQATAQVTTARQQGMGWGAIANANGMKLGGVVSGVEKTAKAVERADKAAAEKAAQSGPSGKSDKGAKGEGAKGDKGGRGADVAGGSGSGGPGGGRGDSGRGDGGPGGGGGGGKGK